MDDERSTGGYGWSTVGQLAPDRTQTEPEDPGAAVAEAGIQAAVTGPPPVPDQMQAAENDPAPSRTDPSREDHPAGPPATRFDHERAEEAHPAPALLNHGLEAVVAEVAVAPASAPADIWPQSDEPSGPPPPDPVPLSPPASGRRPTEVVRPLPRIMAIANQKGGVGKTTTAVNLGAALAELGYRVLVVDLDPQGNATTGLGINARNLQSSIYDVLLNDMSLEDCIEPTAVRNLFLAPAMIDLAGAEIELVPAFSRELRLRRALVELGDEYDFVMIDCPPSLGLLTVNGLAAATEVVVPIQCEYYALEGLGQLLRNVELVQRNLNPPLDLGAIILTMFDARTKLSDQVAREVRQHFGGKVCRNIVPRTVRLSEAPSFGQPIIVFDSTSRGAIAYRELAKEVSGGETRRSR
ncbi:MAG TPA: AAA family ATPase [Acidimicrobiales bacterium]|nr:AAA family ATPase [Acidimicrobiales bacterium]